ncbi:hypothetical protein AVEN_107768-1 [Araneus ventricosus]|uniref:Uncharacterized protein n=1 Tax=Araneus ventricosus TaxID=182803 RepID=A0A4Y2K0P5_ARAVE|nr:hypothetical protein AVEN_107768-1 [Araneus ventricosus]
MKMDAEGPHADYKTETMARVSFMDDNTRPYTARGPKNSFVAWGGRDWITRLTDPILPHQTFSFFLHSSQHYRDASSEAMKNRL